MRKLFVDLMRDKLIYGFTFSDVHFDAEQFYITNINRRNRIVKAQYKKPDSNFVIVSGGYDYMLERFRNVKYNTKYYKYERVYEGTIQY